MYRLLDLSRARTSRLLPWGLIAACLLSGSGIWSPTVRSLAQESEQ
jgi:hypothetical protein